MSAPAASSVLVTYKRLLTLAKRLPSKEAVKAVADIRAAFRRDKTETDPAKISEFLQTAQKKLSYLRIVTPKAPGDDEDNSRGVSRYVVAGDKVVNLAEAGKLADADGKLPSYLSSFREGNLDPDAVRRHEAQLRRVRFMDRGMPAPVSPWQR